ncbi:hypothetical protein [Moorena sp. SIO3E8]|uniref:hypothetical protein n=1 Tax=Moorena sp. SIO3E8 TaxID=2607830 RepID=UPI0014008636|nr:hypothetical protein [Moorena sp. SIO3E8]NEQ03830.1 hypothetical protein [Moorena sp. SIO3F7]
MPKRFIASEAWFTDRVKNRVKKYFRAPWWAVADQLFTNLADFAILATAHPTILEWKRSHLPILDR